jgi:hypothetical protein
MIAGLIAISNARLTAWCCSCRRWPLKVVLAQISCKPSVEPRTGRRKESRLTAEEALPGKPDVGRSLMEMPGGPDGPATTVPAPQLLVHDLLYIHDRLSVA